MKRAGKGGGAPKGGKGGREAKVEAKRARPDALDMGPAPSGPAAAATASLLLVLLGLPAASALLPAPAPHSKRSGGDTGWKAGDKPDDAGGFVEPPLATELAIPRKRFDLSEYGGESLRDLVERTPRSTRR